MTKKRVHTDMIQPQRRQQRQTAQLGRFPTPVPALSCAILPRGDPARESRVEQIDVWVRPCARFDTAPRDPQPEPALQQTSTIK